MADDQDIKVEQIMEQVREKIKRRQQESVSPALSTPAPDGQVSADLASLHSSYDVYHIHFTSDRRILGPFVVFAKKILRQLLTPILTRQVSYNATNTRVVTYLMEQLGTLGKQQARLWETIQASQAQVFTALEERLTQVRAQLQASQTQALQIMGERVSRAERKLRRLLYVLTDHQEEGKAEPVGPQVAPKKVPSQSLEPDFDYFGFEERFRGSEGDIKERQRVYIEYFRGQEDVLDIGCGRGEFLELLREAGIKAKGVDLDLDMILYCKEKGLEVVQEDAFVYLEALPDESLGGIFAAQVIEHLEPSRVIELVKLCHRKLRSGGCLTLETPNPRCLMVFAASFYMDFSHTRPIHPEAMRFLLEAVGFQNVELRYSGPVDAAMRLPSLPDIGLPEDSREAFKSGVERLNDLLYGFQDYAVIGRKIQRYEEY